MALMEELRTYQSSVSCISPVHSPCYTHSGTVHQSGARRSGNNRHSPWGRSYLPSPLKCTTFFWFKVCISFLGVCPLVCECARVQKQPLFPTYFLCIGPNPAQGQNVVLMLLLLLFVCFCFLAWFFFSCNNQNFKVLFKSSRPEIFSAEFRILHFQLFMPFYLDNMPSVYVQICRILSSVPCS